MNFLHMFSYMYRVYVTIELSYNRGLNQDPNTILVLPYVCLRSMQDQMLGVNAQYKRPRQWLNPYFVRAFYHNTVSRYVRNSPLWSYYTDSKQYVSSRYKDIVKSAPFEKLAIISFVSKPIPRCNLTEKTFNNQKPTHIDFYYQINCLFAFTTLLNPSKISQSIMIYDNF